ncbi:DNA mismatch repair protein [Xylographa soralifera]|nr:DNA mismatch repair protein [Xylographa soralifera]
MADMMEVDSPELSRGLKRKADDSRALAQTPKRIKALDQDVVNKIAAGEIIVAPMHALKELIENAVDAGSTSLEIVVKDGGLKLLQITDNGHGINKDDLPILCERFTTSKLKAFEDLTSIGTYGFRGEALASISHIAHLTVTTKTADSSCAYRAHYADGKLVPAKPGKSTDPTPCAGRGGTQITVEDLFYNIRQRQKAFKSHSEEYAKILDVVGRYAVHCQGVAFSSKKHGDSAMGVSVPSNATTVDRIRQIHGTAVANELIEFDVSDERLGFKASGWTSNANYHVKKTAVLLFINHRSVESSAIKQAIQRMYSTFLPKGGHPFIYLSLDIEPQRVDVNVHPTKREVNFLNEDEIIEVITNNIAAQLSKVDTSRTFMTQSLLPGTKVATISTQATTTSRISQPPSATKARNESSLVRTDPSVRKITSMLPPSVTNLHTTLSSHLDPTYTLNTNREPINCRLTTVKDLRAAVRAEMHSNLTEVFASHTYVGLVDSLRRIAAIQSGVKLYLVDYGKICNEYFYQVGLTDFANFGSIVFDPPLDVQSLIRSAVEIEQRNPPEGQPKVDDGAIAWEAIPKTVTQQLIQRREMLSEYFCLDISEEGQLLGIPLLVKGYVPSLAKLPRFLMRLGPCVNWMDEQKCFETFLGELASYYTPEQLPNEESLSKGKGNSTDAATEHAVTETGSPGETSETSKENDGLTLRREQLARMLEHILFPAFRARLVATKDLLQGVTSVADLKGLYRVFERC